MTWHCVIVWHWQNICGSWMLNVVVVVWPSVELCKLSAIELIEEAIANMWLHSYSHSLLLIAHAVTHVITVLEWWSLACLTVYTSIHQCTPVYTSIHQCTPVYTCIHQYTPVYTSVHQYTPVYTSIHQYTPVYTSKHWIGFHMRLHHSNTEIPWVIAMCNWELEIIKQL